MLDPLLKFSISLHMHKQLDVHFLNFPSVVFLLGLDELDDDGVKVEGLQVDVGEEADCFGVGDWGELAYLVAHRYYYKRYQGARVNP